jgi:hypothetical protein
MMPSYNYIPISDDYGNMGCQVSKERIQNWIEFRPKINKLQGNYGILWIFLRKI